MKQCSDLFLDAFRSNSSGFLRECKCGRIHFDGYNPYDEEIEDERKELRDLAFKEPFKYFEHDYIISAIIVNGEEIVPECQCGFALTSEMFLINNDSSIAEYLNGRSKELHKQADSLHKEAEKIKVDVK